MKTIKANNIWDIPKNYTGIVEFPPGIVEFSRERKEWWLNGQLHRTNGPAIIWTNGTKHWFLNGKRHREDGPAVEFSGGGNYWCLNGRWLDENKINQFVDEFDYPVEVAIKLAYFIN